MINAKVVADSLCPRGHRLTTLEVVMPRYILAEFNTHRVFTRNSASSRAIRLSKTVASVLTNTFIPYAWQQDHSGMQGTVYLDPTIKYGLMDFIDKAEKFFSSEDEQEDKELKAMYTSILSKPEYSDYKTLEEWWLLARDKAVECATLMNIFGATKQICNRLLEPFMYHKVLVSSTEWNNFFELRCPQYQTPVSQTIELQKSWKDLINNHGDEENIKKLQSHKDDNLFKLQHNKGQADIHMMFTAEAIYDAINENTAKQLKEGEWHVPYSSYMDSTTISKILTGTSLDEIVQAHLKIAIVRCARVSYHIAGKEQVIDYEADLKLYDRLATSGHWSPFEHVARVMTEKEFKYYRQSSPTGKEGVLHVEEGVCRNFRGFIQQRAMMD